MKKKDTLFLADFNTGLDSFVFWINIEDPYRYTHTRTYTINQT